MKRSSRRATAITLAVLALVLPQTACQYSLEMWAEPGSHVDSVVIRFGEGRSSPSKVVVKEIGVFPCSDIRDRGTEGFFPRLEQAVWSAAARREKPTPTDRVEYGKVPAGLETVAGPVQFEHPGCYAVRASVEDSNGDLRIATMGLTVTEGGDVYQMSQAAFDRLFSGKR